MQNDLDLPQQGEVGEVNASTGLARCRSPLYLRLSGVWNGSLDGVGQTVTGSDHGRRHEASH
jgi:hypothetical protein